MSNLFKYNTIINKDERIIDYNEVIKDKIKNIIESEKSNGDSGFVNGLNAPVVETIDPEEHPDDEQDNAESDGADKEDMQAYENARIEADSIIEQAKEEADKIIKDANAQAEVLRGNAQKKGYDEGRFKVQGEYDNKVAQLEEEYKLREKELNADYEKKVKEIEPELVNVILDVVSNVTHAVSSDSSDIVINLVNDVLKDVEVSHEYLIKVSSDDYEYVVSNQKKIYCSTSDVNIDIVQDTSLKKNECIIETDTGVFNCSLDVEMKNLIKNIKMLSCM